MHKKQIQLRWLRKTDKTITVSFIELDKKKTHTLIFNGSFWSRITPKENVFSAFNDYVNQRFTDERIVELFNIYREIYKFFNESFEMRSMPDRFMEYTHKIFSLFDWDDIHNWVIDPANGISITPGRKEHIDNMHSVDKTYLTEDYIALLCLSLIMKPILPIVGEYTVSVKKSIEEPILILNLYDMIYNAYSLNKEPLYKLDRYMNAVLNDVSDANVTFYTIGAKLTSNTSMAALPGTVDLPEYFKGSCVLRRIALFNLRASSDMNIVSDFFQHIQDKLKNIASGSRINIKKERTSKEEEDTFGDMFRLSTNIPDGVIALLEDYGNKYELYLSKIDPAIDLSEFVVKFQLNYDNILRNSHLTIMDTHVKVLSILLYDIIPAVNIALLSKELVIKLIVIAYTLFSREDKWHLPALAIIMKMSAEELTEETLPLDAVLNMGYRNLTIEQKKRLHEPFQAQGGLDPNHISPYDIITDSIISELALYTWPQEEKLVILDHIKDDIYRLMCLRIPPYNTQGDTL